MSRELVQRKAREWFFAVGLAKPGDSHATVMRRLAEYRAKLPSMPKSADKAWAREILARYETGERVADAALRLAREALGMEGMPLLRRPDPPPPRPDAKERQAGDVEPAF